MAREKGFEAEGLLGDVVQSLTEGIQNAGPIPVNVDLVINTGQLEAAIRQMDAFMSRMKLTANVPLPVGTATGKPAAEQAAPLKGKPADEKAGISKDAADRFSQAVQKFEVQVKNLGESAKALAAAAAAPAQSSLNSELLVAIKALATSGNGGNVGQTTFLTDDGVVAASSRTKKPAPATTSAEAPEVATMRAELTARIAALSKGTKTTASTDTDNKVVDAAITKINKLFEELGDLGERSTIATRTLRALAETLKDLQIDFQPLNADQKGTTVRKSEQLVSQIDNARGDFSAIQGARAKQQAAEARELASKEAVAKELNGLKRQLADLNATVNGGSDKIGSAIDAAVKELESLDLGDLDETKLEQGIKSFLRKLEASGAGLDAIGAVSSLVRSQFQGIRMGSSANTFDPATGFVANTNDTSYDPEGTLTPTEVANAKARRGAKPGGTKKKKKPAVQESEVLLDSMASAEIDDIFDIVEAKDAIRETLKNAETFKKRLLEFLSIGDTLAAEGTPAAAQSTTRRNPRKPASPPTETSTRYASEEFSTAGVKLFADFDWATLVTSLTSFGTALGTATERLRGFVPANIESLRAQRAATPAPGVSSVGGNSDGGFAERTDAGAARGIGLFAEQSLVRLNRKVLSSQELLKQYRTTTKTYREFIQGVAASSSELDTSELQAALKNPDPIVQGGLDTAFENRGGILAKRNRTLLANDSKRQQTAETREGALTELRTRYPNLARALANSSNSATIPLPQGVDLSIPVARGTNIKNVTLGSIGEISAKLELEQVDKALKRIYQTETGAPRIPRSFTRQDFVGEIARAFSGSLDGTTSGFSGVPTGAGGFERQDLSQGKSERALRTKLTPLLLEVLPRLFKEGFAGVDLTQTTGPQIVEIVKTELAKRDLTRGRIDAARAELQDEFDRNGGVVRAQALAKFDRLGPSLLVAQQLEKGELQPVPAALNPNRVVPFLNNLRKFEGFQSSEQSSKRIAAQLGRLPNDPEAQASFRTYSDRATTAQAGRESVEAALLDDIKNGGFGELLAAGDLREPFKVREVIERLAKGTGQQEFGLPKGESLESANDLKKQLTNILKIKRSLDSAIAKEKRTKGTDNIREARLNIKQLRDAFTSAFESLGSIEGIFVRPDSIEQFDVESAKLGRGTLTKGLERQLSTREATGRETALRRRRQDLEARIKGGAVASITVNDESFSEVPRQLVNDAIGGLGSANSLLTQARRLVPKNVFNNLARGVSPSKFGTKLGTGPQEAAELIAQFRTQVLKAFDESPVLQSFGGSRPTAFQDQVNLVENVGPALRALSGVGRKLAGPRDPLPGVMFRLRNEALPDSSGAGTGNALDLVSETEKKELAAFGYEFVEFSKQQIADIQAARKRIRDEQAKPGQGIRQLGFLKGLETRAKLIEGLGGEFVKSDRPDFRELESFLFDKSGDAIDPLAASISPLADRFLDSKTTARTRNQQNLRDLPGLEAQRKAISARLADLQPVPLRAILKPKRTVYRRANTKLLDKDDVDPFEYVSKTLLEDTARVTSVFSKNVDTPLDLRPIAGAVNAPEIADLSKQLQGVLGRISDIMQSERPPNLSRKTTQERVSAVDTLQATLAGLKEELAAVQARGASPRKLLEARIADARLGLGSNGVLVRAATDARAGLNLLGPAFNNTFAGQAAPAQRLSEASQGISELQALITKQSAALKALPPDAKNLNPIDGSSPRDFYSEGSLKERIHGIEERIRRLNKQLQLGFAKSVPKQVSPAALQNASDRALANETLPDFAKFPNAPRGGGGGGGGGGGNPPAPPRSGPDGPDGPNRSNILVQILAELKAHTVLLGGGGLGEIGNAGSQVNAVGKAFTQLASVIRESNIAISAVMRRPVQENVIGAIRTNNLKSRLELLSEEKDKDFNRKRDYFAFKQGFAGATPLPISDKDIAVPREISAVALQELLPEIRARLSGFNSAGIGIEGALAELQIGGTPLQQGRSLRKLSVGNRKQDVAGELLLNTAERAVKTLPKAGALSGVEALIATVRAEQATLRPELALRNDYRAAEANAVRKGLTPEVRAEREAEQAKIGATIPGGIVELERTIQAKRDSIQRGLGQVAGAMANLDQEGKRFGGVKKFSDSLRTLSQYAGAGAIVFGAVSAVRAGFRELVSFEAELTRVQGILGVTSNAVRDKIQGDITAAAQQYGVSIREALEAFKVFAQAGDNRTQAISRTRASLAAVQGLGIAPGQAQELLIATGNITNDRVSSNEVLDRISQVERTNAVTSQDLSVAIQRVGSIAQQFQPQTVGGIDAIDLVSGLATEIIEKTRVSGNQAATSLRFILARLASPEIATKLQKNFDINLGGKNENELRPLSDILQDIGAKYKELTAEGNTVKAGELLATFAGARQINAAAALFEDFGKVLDVATESSRAFGDTQRRLALQQETLQFQLQQLATAVSGNFELFVRNSGVLTSLKGIAGVGAEQGGGLLGLAAENPLTATAATLGGIVALGVALTGLATMAAAAGLATLAAGLAAFATGPVLVGLGLLTTLVGGLAIGGKAYEAFQGGEGTQLRGAELLTAARKSVQDVPQFKEFSNTAAELGTTRSGLIEVGLAGNAAGAKALRDRFGTDDIQRLLKLDPTQSKSVRNTFDKASIEAVRAGLGGKLEEQFVNPEDQDEFARSLLRKSLVQLRATPETLIGGFQAKAEALAVGVESARDALPKIRYEPLKIDAVSAKLPAGLGSLGDILEAVINTAKSGNGTSLLTLVQRSRSANLGQLLEFIGATILNPKLTDSQNRIRSQAFAIVGQKGADGKEFVPRSSEFFAAAGGLVAATAGSAADKTVVTETLLTQQRFAEGIDKSVAELLDPGAVQQALNIDGDQPDRGVLANDPTAVIDELIKSYEASVTKTVNRLKQLGDSPELTKALELQRGLQSSKFAESTKAKVTDNTDSPFRGFVKDRLADAVLNFALATREIRVFGAAVKAAGGTFDELAERQAASQNFVKQLSGLDGDVFRNFVQVQQRLTQINENAPKGSNAALPSVGEEDSNERRLQNAVILKAAASSQPLNEEQSKQVTSLTTQANQLFAQLEILTDGGKNFDAFNDKTRETVETVFKLDPALRSFFLAQAAPEIRAGAAEVFKRDTEALANRERSTTAIGSAGALGQAVAQFEALDRVRQRTLAIRLQELGGDRFGARTVERGNQQLVLTDRLAAIAAGAQTQRDQLALGPSGDVERTRELLKIDTGAGKDSLDAIGAALKEARDGVDNQRFAQEERLQGIKESVVAPFTNALAEFFSNPAALTTGTGRGGAFGALGAALAGGFQSQLGRALSDNLFGENGILGKSLRNLMGDDPLLRGADAIKGAIDDGGANFVRSLEAVFNQAARAQFNNINGKPGKVGGVVTTATTATSDTTKTLGGAVPAAVAATGVAGAVAAASTAKAGNTLDTLSEYYGKLPGSKLSKTPGLSKKIYDEAVKNGVDPNIAFSMFYQESRFNPNAKSPVGAEGIGQLMPTTIIDAETRRDPFKNVAASLAYYAEQKKLFGTDAQALAAYNAGPSRVARSQLSGKPLPKETQLYVPEILERAAAAGQQLRIPQGPATTTALPSDPLNSLPAFDLLERIKGPLSTDTRTSVANQLIPISYSLPDKKQPTTRPKLGQTAQAFQQLGIFAGSSLGTAVGTRGANANSGAQLGSSLGSTAGTIAGSKLGETVGAAFGSAAGSVVPVIGTFLGAALGGYIGKQLAPGSKDQQSDPLQRIERNTRETITAIENQTGKLLDLNNRLINVPTSFAVPSYRPSDVGGGGGIQVSGGISITVQGSGDPAATAQAVYDRLQSELRTQATFVDSRGI